MLVTSDRRTHVIHGADGFTLLEALTVVAIVATLAAMVVPVTTRFVSESKADSSIVAAVEALELARSRAIAERRNFELEFVPPNRIVVRRLEVPGPAKPIVTEVLLENGQEFRKFSGVTNTPDQFAWSQPVSFSGTTPVMFTSDGSLIDSNGDVANGTLFLGRPNQIETARAITVFGVTGLMRTWKWGGDHWLD
jgi:prepilin-type N-terminal cleavage/methylation domain-containing protein